MSLWDIPGEIFWNIPKSVVTGQYQGIASKEKISVPANVRFPMVGGTVRNVASLGTKMFGVSSGKTVITNFPWKSAALVGGGALAGYGVTSLFGGTEKKQEQQLDQKLDQKLNQEPKIIYNVGRDFQPNYDQRSVNQYDIISNSPGSAIYSEKKAEQGGSTPSWTQPMSFGQSAGASQGAEQGQTAAPNLLLPAMVLSVAVLGYGYFSKKKRK